MSLQNLEAQARRHENRSRRILRRLIGGREGRGDAKIWLSEVGRPEERSTPAFMPCLLQMCKHLFMTLVKILLVFKQAFQECPVSIRLNRFELLKSLGYG